MSSSWFAKLRDKQEIDSWKQRDDGSYWAPAKGLDITWADTKDKNRYWKWEGDTAELQQSWLVEINTIFDTSKLSRGKKYGVFFVLKLTDSASGWDSPVTLQLSFPDNPMKPRTEDFKRLRSITNDFQDVLVGEFEASGNNKGMLDIKLVQNDRRYTKTGLVVKGVEIVPYPREGQPA